MTFVRPLRTAALAGLALVALATGGCGLLPREPVVPMPSRLDRAACPAGTLLVLLPGRGMGMDALDDEGFVAAVREAGLAVDVMRADAHLAYYRNRSIVPRLHDDLLAPARRAGWTHVWLAGISLGGFGALAYADAHPGEVDGLVLLAPYLGEPASVAEVARAGGLARWQPPMDAATEAADPIGAHAWRALRSPALPPLYLGFGATDRLAPGHRLLAGALPPGHVATAPGGHDWAPWRATWRELLSRAPLPRCG